MSPHEKESEAHETFSLMFKHDGVPPRMIVNNSKEQSLGEFRRKCREVDCHLVNTEATRYGTIQSNKRKQVDGNTWLDDGQSLMTRLALLLKRQPSKV